MAGGTAHLITADREVLLLRGYAATEFATLGEFLEILSRQAEHSSDRPAS